MKNKLKYLIITALAITMISASAVSAKAEEIDTTATTDTETVETAEEHNLFAEVYEDVTAYASEILCALTLAGSLTLAVAYKKGLLPLLESSLVAIGNAVSKIKENAKESADKNSELTASIEARLEGAEKIIDTLASRVGLLATALEASLKSEDDARRDKEQLRIVMNAQVDMLYDIFMTSALPQYQKDAVGERIAKMKEAIAENGCEN